MAERSYRIHPAIGIARVGDADRAGNEFFFIGPEVPGVPPNFDTATGKYRAFKIDGKIKPQAARFRIFEYEKGADGKFRPTGEVKLGDGRTTKITWTVHLANRKASFCSFNGQVGAAADPLFSDYKPAGMRNPKIKGLDERRSKLELDPGPRSIDGADAQPVDFTINRPPLKIDTLGQIRSDDAGRLIVIGGKGRSDFDPALPRSEGKPDDPVKPGDIVNYANNDGWFDDVSDGPVGAEIVIDGATKPVEGAWVMVGPPDFSPATRSYRTMYDTLVDLVVREIPIPADDGLFVGPLADIAAMQNDWKKADLTLSSFRPSFTAHIYPILASVARMARLHRSGPFFNRDVTYHGMLDPARYAQLGGAESDADVRDVIFTMLRDPKTLVNNVRPVQPTLMPVIFGDYYTEANGRGGAKDPAFFHSVSLLQYALLRAWNEGRFEADWVNEPPIPTNATVTPEGLDRAALENAVGGPFYPGIEGGWLLTKAQVFQSPLRIDRGKTVGKVPVPGTTTKRDVVLEAGAFSQQMALPWQADFLDCKSDEVTIGGKIRKIGWWPVQRPTEVFADTSRTERLDWARTSDGVSFRYEDMIEKWATLGFVIDTNNNLFEVDGPSPLVS